MSVPLARFLPGVPFPLPTRPPMVLFRFGVPIIVVDLDFLGVTLLLADGAAPRAGASERSPESISALSAAASFLMMRKRPSMES